MFDQLAEELKKARLKNNINLKQLSSRTRIDIKFLEAIEEGNFSFLPEIYVKAFIKEYANVVGLDPEKILKKYEAAKEGLPYEEPEEYIEEIPLETPGPLEQNTPEKKPEVESGKTSEDKHQQLHSDDKRKKEPPKPSLPKIVQTPILSNPVSPPSGKTGNKNNYLIGAVIGGVIILFGLIYLIFFKSSSEIIVTEKPYDEVVTESRQRYDEKPAKVADTSRENSTSDSLHLQILTSDTSWVKIIIDNTNEQEFILFPNSQKSLKAADNFQITFGRSSAIKLQLNNKPLGFNPKTKSVSYVKINSKGLEFLQYPPKKGND